MGIDCCVKIDGKEHSLDRFYIFYDLFDTGKKYDKKRAIEQLEYRIQWQQRLVDILKAAKEDDFIIETT